MTKHQTRSDPNWEEKREARLEGPVFLALAALWLAMVVAMAQYNSLDNLAPIVGRFGNEYGNIAESLIKGHGYSNPFPIPSGPTAWMPPVPVLIYAAVFAVFGIKTTLSGLVLLLLKSLALTASLGLLWQASKVCSLAGGWPTLFILGVVALFGRYDWLTRDVMDQWLVILVSALTILALAEWQDRGVRTWHGILALLLPLTAPPVALGFGLLLAWKFVRRQPGALPLLACFALATGLWMIRNGLALGTPYPLKSNLAYEFYQANAWSPSGLLTDEVLIRHHPILPGNPTASEFATLGEQQTCARYGALSGELIQNQPAKVFKNIGRRAFSAFVATHPQGDMLGSRLVVHPEDAQVLAQQRLMRYQSEPPHWQSWLIVHFPESEAQEQLSRLELINPDLVWASWEASRSESLDRSRSLLARARAFGYALVPSMAIICLLWVGGWHSGVVRDALVLYLAYFLPYVLISHWERYQISALALQLWLVWLALAHWPAKGNLPARDLDSGSPPSKDRKAE